MIKRYAKLLAGTCALAACATIAAPEAQAQGLTWNYGMDSHSDGTGWINGVRGDGGVGYNSLFEGFGMAYAVDDENVTFAFNANFGLNGHNDIGATDGNITWGDFFLNFDPTKTFREAQAAGTALGIRFAAGNDSQIGGSRTGVFKDITTTDVTAANMGHQSYSGYNSQVRGFGGEVENIDGQTVQESEQYMGTHGHSVLNSVTWIGDITMLTRSALKDTGLRFGQNGGVKEAEVFGFSFARSLLPGGSLNWVAHVMAECANDTLGMEGTFTAQVTPPGGGGGGNPEEPVGTPEPSVMLGSMAALYGAWKGKRRAKKQVKG